MCVVAVGGGLLTGRDALFCQTAEEVEARKMRSLWRRNGKRGGSGI
jgi:hypothetical protein